MIMGTPFIILKSFTQGQTITRKKKLLLEILFGCLKTKKNSSCACLHSVRILCVLSITKNESQ